MPLTVIVLFGFLVGAYLLFFEARPTIYSLSWLPDSRGLDVLGLLFLQPFHPHRLLLLENVSSMLAHRSAPLSNLPFFLGKCVLGIP